MTSYELLTDEAHSNGLIVKEKSLRGSDGRIRGKRIAIRKDIQTQAEKACVLAEEIGHYYTSSGDIIDMSDTGSQKQELRARLWAYNKQIGLAGIVDAYRHNCHNIYEMAEYLEVTEKFLLEALQRYRSKYGTCAVIDRFVIYFEPRLAVLEII